MHFFPYRYRAIIASVLTVAIGGSVQAENWPQWRGPTGDGVSTETHLPTEWSATHNIAWKLALPGMGGSTPAVWNSQIFLTCADDKEVALVCVSTEGKLLWKRDFGGAGRKVRGDEGNGASASPSTDGQHVFVFCGTGELACFDLEGKEVWKFNVQDRYGKFNIQFGMHSSPVLDGDRLYLQLLHTDGAKVIALDKATGKEVWAVTRKSDGTHENLHSYASPVLYRNGKVAYLITHGNNYAVAHRLEDGAEIWRVGGLNPANRGDFRFVASPLATPDLIIIPSAKHGPIVGLDPEAKGLVVAGNRYEKWRLPKSTPDVPCALVHDGLAYLCGEDGLLTCVEANSGREIYSQRTHSARFRASPVYADGKVYLTGRDGVVVVVKAGRHFEILATNKLPDEISASPAIANGRIYLHGFETLFAVAESSK